MTEEDRKDAKKTLDLLHMGEYAFDRPSNRIIQELARVIMLLDERTTRQPPHDMDVFVQNKVLSRIAAGKAKQVGR